MLQITLGGTTRHPLVLTRLTAYPHRMRNTGRSIIGAMLAAALLSCSPSAIGFHIPTVPVAGQSPTEVEADRAACERAAPPGIDRRQRTYQACMISRNYWAYVKINFTCFPNPDAPACDVPFEIRQTRPHDAAMVAGDLDECQRATRAAGEWGRLTTGQKTGAVLVGGTAGRGDLMEAALSSCFEQRGYAIQRWEPSSPKSPPLPRR